MALEAEGLNAFFDGYYRHREFANRQAQEARTAALSQRELTRIDNVAAEYDADAGIRASGRQLKAQQLDTNLQVGGASQPGLVAQAKATAAQQEAGASQTLLNAVGDAQNAQTIKSRTLEAGAQASEVQKIEMDVRARLAKEPSHAAAVELMQRWNSVKAPLDHALATNNMAQANELGASVELEFRTVPGAPGEPPMVQAKTAGAPETAWAEFTDLASVPRLKARIMEFERRVQEESRLQIQADTLRARLDIAKINNAPAAGVVAAPDATAGATLTPVAPTRAANAAAAPVTATRLKPVPARTPDEAMPNNLMVGAY